MKHLTGSRAQAVAAVAYLFLYPLVMGYRGLYRQAVDSSSSVFSGGFGKWRHTVVSEPRTGGPGRPRQDAGMDDGLSDLLEAATEPGAGHSGCFGRADMDRDYFRRAVGALGLSGRPGE